MAPSFAAALPLLVAACVAAAGGGVSVGVVGLASGAEPDLGPTGGECGAGQSAKCSRCQMNSLTHFYSRTPALTERTWRTDRIRGTPRQSKHCPPHTLARAGSLIPPKNSTATTTRRHANTVHDHTY